MDTSQLLASAAIIVLMVVAYVRKRRSRVTLGGKPQNAHVEALRCVLYGDMELQEWTALNNSEEAPWGLFAEARNHSDAGRVPEAVSCLQQVLRLPALEPRHYIQAWHFLRRLWFMPPTELEHHVVGVVVEVPMKDGLDLLAAYGDRTARYYNYSGAGVVWEHPDDTLDEKIDALLTAAAWTASQIGHWTGVRPGPPPLGQMRLSFLTPAGLQFGQAESDVLMKDAKAAAVVKAALALMLALTAKAGQERPSRESF